MFRKRADCTNITLAKDIFSNNNSFSTMPNLNPSSHETNRDRGSLARD